MRGYVVLNGIPGSGKSTIARPLADELGVPLIAKDTIKEAFVDAYGAVDGDESKRIGGACVAVMHAIAQGMSGALLEGPFRRGVGEEELSRYGRGRMVQVFCRCPLEVAVERCEQRAARGERHPAHVRDRTWHLDDRIEDFSEPLDLDAPLLVVDTTKPVDVCAVAEWVRAAMPCSD